MLLTDEKRKLLHEALGETFAKLMKCSSRLILLGQAIPVATANAATQNEALRRKIVDSLVGPTAPPLQRDILAEQLRNVGGLNAFSAEHLEGALAAATLVLVHSQLDIIISDLIGTAVEFDPEKWERLAVAHEKRTFTLGNLLSHDKDSLLADAFRKYKSAISRKSLTERNALLMRQIPPQPFDSNLSSLFRRAVEDDIKQFDLMRHRIVHSDPFADSGSLADVAMCGAMLSHITYLLINAAVYFKLDYTRLLFQFYASGAAAKTVAEVAEIIKSTKPSK